jgi:hypothetical protein
MLMPHSITDGDACFAYFNKRWGIPGGGEQRRWYVETKLTVQG